MAIAPKPIDANTSSIDNVANVPQGMNNGESWIFFVCGSTGSGKSSIANFLASNLQARFIEGDDLHPKANIDKMHKGEALTDSDRQGWLEAINEQAAAYNKQRSQYHHLIITCSALKRAYRDILRESCQRAGYPLVHFFFLDAPEFVLRQRTEARQNHFAKANLVHSQFEVLERPKSDESDATIISVVPSEDEVQSETLDAATEVINKKPSVR